MAGTRRLFPAEFKAQVVLDLLSGAASQADLCRKHNIKPQLLTYWRASVVERLHTLFREGQTNQDQVRIAELEQLVGRQALELEILKKASRLLPGLLGRDGRSS